MKEITDMVTLRAYAIKQAIASGESPDYIVATAEKFADFIKGDAELPEYDDPNAGQKVLVDMYREMQADKAKSNREIEESLNRMRESFSFVIPKEDK